MKKNRCVYLNQKKFDIHVASPDGAGRILETGYAVEGDFFTSQYLNGSPLTRLNDQEIKEFPANKIIFKHYFAKDEETFETAINRVVKISNLPLTAQSDENEVVQAMGQRVTPMSVDSDKKEENTDLETAFSTAANSMSGITPTKNDLKKLNNDELIAECEKEGISSAGLNRNKMLKALTERKEGSTR